jgi:hypothetical protein
VVTDPQQRHGTHLHQIFFPIRDDAVGNLAAAPHVAVHKERGWPLAPGCGKSLCVDVAGRGVNVCPEEFTGYMFFCFTRKSTRGCVFPHGAKSHPADPFRGVLPLAKGRPAVGIDARGLI